MCVIDHEMMLISNAIPSAACLFFLLKNSAIMGSSIKIRIRKLKASTILLLLCFSKTCGFNNCATTMICCLTQIEVTNFRNEDVQF